MHKLSSMMLCAALVLAGSDALADDAGKASTSARRQQTAQSKDRGSKTHGSQNHGSQNSVSKGNAHTKSKAPSTRTKGAPLARSKALKLRQRSEQLIADTLRQSDEVRRRLRTARNRQEARRSTCLSSMLSQSHAVERRAEREHRALLQDLESAASERLGWRMQRLQALQLRARELVREARLCGLSPVQRRRLPTAYSVTVHAPPLPRYRDQLPWPKMPRRKARAAKVSRSVSR